MVLPAPFPTARCHARTRWPAGLDGVVTAGRQSALAEEGAEERVALGGSSRELDAAEGVAQESAFLHRRDHKAKAIESMRHVVAAVGQVDGRGGRVRNRLQPF